MKWNKGDWCFYEFNLCQITEMDGGRVTGVSDGSFNTHGRDLSDNCVPLTLRHSAITDHAEYWSARLHKEGNSALNYPDIHRKLVDLWLECCQAKGDDATTKANERLTKFGQGILQRVMNIGHEQIDGVQLFRNR